LLQGFVTKGEKAMKGVDTAAAFVCISALFSVAALVCMADDLPADVPYMSVALVIDAPLELPAGGGDFVVTVRVEDSLRLAGFQIQLEFYRDDPETRLATAVVVPVKKSFTVSVRNRGCDIGSYEVELEDPAPPEKLRKEDSPGKELSRMESLELFGVTGVCTGRDDVAGAWELWLSSYATATMRYTAS